MKHTAFVFGGWRCASCSEGTFVARADFRAGRLVVLPHRLDKRLVAALDVARGAIVVAGYLSCAGSTDAYVAISEDAGKRFTITEVPREASPPDASVVAAFHAFPPNVELVFSDGDCMIGAIRTPLALTESACLPRPAVEQKPRRIRVIAPRPGQIVLVDDRGRRATLR